MSMSTYDRKSYKQEIEDIDTILRYIDYFDYGFSEKNLNKKKKKLMKYKEKLEKALKED